MQKIVEVELKYEVLDKKQLQNFVRGLSFIEVKSIHDVYFDTKEGELYQRGIFIRLRNGKYFDFKFNEVEVDLNKYSEHGHCNEHSFDLPFDKSEIHYINDLALMLRLKPITKTSIAEFMKKNNLIQSVVIQKIRKIYKDAQYEFSLDEAEGLGTYLEIEAHALPHDDVGHIKTHMKKRLSSLRLKLITTGYNELYWRKHNFNLYLKGRYLLEEDYKKYRPGQM